MVDEEEEVGVAGEASSREDRLRAGRGGGSEGVVVADTAAVGVGEGTEGEERAESGGIWNETQRC